MHDTAPRCDGCREVYALEEPPAAPPCGTCRVPVMPENEEAVRIFHMVRNQLIMGSGGPVAVNHLAVHAAMELYRIERPRECFAKVNRLAVWWLNKITEKAEGHESGGLEP
jgi:hypothetical protein